MFVYLLLGTGKRIYGESARNSQIAQVKANAEDAAGFTRKSGLSNYPLSEKDRKANYHKSKVLPRFKQVFGVVKHQLSYCKVAI